MTPQSVGWPPLCISMCSFQTSTFQKEGGGGLSLQALVVFKAHIPCVSARLMLLGLYLHSLSPNISSLRIQELWKSFHSAPPKTSKFNNWLLVVCFLKTSSSEQAVCARRTRLLDMRPLRSVARRPLFLIR